MWKPISSVKRLQNLVKSLLIDCIDVQAERDVGFGEVEDTKYRDDSEDGTDE